MRRRLNMTERRATSVGCAVKTGEMQIFLRRSWASVCGDAGFAEAAEGSAQVAALGRGVLVELGGETAALAVVGLGEVDELEVKAEGAGELVGGGEVVGVGVDSRQRACSRVGAGVAVSALESASRRAMAVRRRSSTAV